MMTDNLFRRPANRFCIVIPSLGFVPLAQAADDIPQFLTAPPQREGDDCLIAVEGKERKARLLRASGGTLFLVDMGPNKPLRAIRQSSQKEQK